MLRPQAGYVTCTRLGEPIEAGSAAQVFNAPRGERTMNCLTGIAG